MVPSSDSVFQLDGVPLQQKLNHEDYKGMYLEGFSCKRAQGPSVGVVVEVHSCDAQ